MNYSKMCILMNKQHSKSCTDVKKKDIKNKNVFKTHKT